MTSKFKPGDAVLAGIADAYFICETDNGYFVRFLSGDEHEYEDVKVRKRHGMRWTPVEGESVLAENATASFTVLWTKAGEASDGKYVWDVKNLQPVAGGFPKAAEMSVGKRSATPAQRGVFEAGDKVKSLVTGVTFTVAACVGEAVNLKGLGSQVFAACDFMLVESSASKKHAFVAGDKVRYKDWSLDDTIFTVSGYTNGILQVKFPTSTKNYAVSEERMELVTAEDAKQMEAARFARTTAPALGGYGIISPDEAAKKYGIGSNPVFCSPEQAERLGKNGIGSPESLKKMNDAFKASSFGKKTPEKMHWVKVKCTTCGDVPDAEGKEVAWASMKFGTTRENEKQLFCPPCAEKVAKYVAHLRDYPPARKNSKW